MAIAINRFERDPQRIVDAIIQLVEGRSNNVGDCTLATGTTTTVVQHPNCSVGCRVFLEAQTANAAGLSTTVYIPVSGIIAGQFTIRHAVSALTDLTYSFACVGG